MERKTTHRRDAVIAGAFFITATVTAMIGITLYDPILKNADSLAGAAANSNQIALGALFELVLAIANIGTGVMLFPFLRGYSESWGLAYVCFRMLEVVFILIGLLSLLSLLKLSQDYGSTSGSELMTLQIAANTLKTIHSWAFILGPHFMLGVNTFIYSSIFYRSGLVPRNLSLLGVIGAILILIAAILELFGIIPHFSMKIILFALPIAVYEMVLAVRLIRKGFNPQALTQQEYLSEAY
jgi:hypothetical protein